MVAYPPDRTRENELLRRLSEGDPSGFDELYGRFLPGVRAIVRRRVRRVERAEELEAEAMTRVFEHRDRYDPSYDCAIAWVVRIARHLALDEVRKATRWRRWMDEFFGDPDEGLSDGLPPDTVLDGRRVEERVAVAFATLPPSQQKVFECVSLLGMTLDETARALELSPQAVKALNFRARRGLQLKLADERGAA